MSVLVAVLAIAELSLRLVDGGCYAFMPYTTSDFASALPPNRSFCVLGAQRERVEYATDRWSARRSSAANAAEPCRDCVLAVGDSQALGEGLRYEQTLTALYAERHGRSSAILAAPASDPDGERVAAARYVALSGAAPRVAIVVVNLGDDLDELFLARRGAPVSRTAARLWPAEHSWLFASGSLLLQRFRTAPEWIRPGANPAAFALDASDMPVVVRELRAAALAVVRETRARSGIVVVIPPDVVVDPGEFEKYRPFYRAGDFESWRARVPRTAQVMSEVEDGLVRELRASGARVLDAREVLRRIGAERAFDRSSDRLTAPANLAIAEALS